MLVLYGLKCYMEFLYEGLELGLPYQLYGVYNIIILYFVEKLKGLKVQLFINWTFYNDANVQSNRNKIWMARQFTYNDVCFNNNNY